MAVMTTMFVVAWLGAGPGDEPSKLAVAAAVETFTSTAPAGPVPKIAFEVHDITVASPDWRGKMLAQLEPVARQEGSAVWALDQKALADLLKYCQNDARCNVVQSPRMISNVGEPARMTNETSVKYVAHLKRVSDGPPNEGTHIAFVPEIGEVHDGIRVNVTSSQLKGQILFAKVAIEQNQVLAFLTTTYTEGVKPQSKDKEKEKDDPGVVKTSLLERLRPEHANAASINGTIQIPEVVSKRIEGEWMIPSEGALLVSMGPAPRRHDKGLRQSYQERLVAITARPAPEPPIVTVPAPAPAQSKAPATP
ncbi:hypothetical protein [Paludisphaera borealis]|uniref:Uncharacterized protein n=1 Tax=Paludisphaera borealis TaxID=1387353 RepID=A0A1U7CKA5_9BACT|nr:hypothetical protein [Paludisphaera borealis]APW59365.1 hypothetical protein BSF38_00787 [Paludisphaera borealis]